MCGIIGAISNQLCITSELRSGLKHLAYRGYDSVGVCLQLNELEIFKALGQESNLEIPPTFATTGIGHARWATHGVVSLNNAHPQQSHGAIAVTHNGIIHNYIETKDFLIKKNYVFSSETDSEVIPHLLHYYLMQGLTPLNAIKKAQDRLKGRYVFLAIFRDFPNHIFVLSNGIPVYLGKKADIWLIASDIGALSGCISYTSLPNNLPLFICPKGPSTPQDFYSIPKTSKPSTITESITYAEILEQASLPLKFDANWDSLLSNLPTKITQALITACGSSFHCGQILKQWLTSKGVIVLSDIASELKEQVLPNLENTIVIAISQSGETADTLVALQKILATPHLHSIAITNTPTSTLASLCRTTLPLLAGPEIGVASTKAVTAQLICLYKLFCKLTQTQDTFNAQETSLAIRHTLKLKTVFETAKRLQNQQSIYCLGKRELLPIAQELALKIKEICYIHAEAIAAGEMKHGPLALIDENTICLVLDDRNCHYIQTAIAEIEARKGTCILLTSAPNPWPHKNSIIVPHIATPLDIIPINIACQLISYYLATLLNRSIDKPRNLAKSVTVE